ncbi:uncharacterized protein GGS22DRAFT_162233 [Annulohypoxylon maeteangense]|uniref:uncharacterized protein n=1 Tax=Annulohypoxylon maeteangense TaxID=1927788 RepID=UPI0020082B47|nr:uncharacterized protein GGS22DRAFT_162233 [Annulohypoxylon maeteangense]KAI0885891.1 hypothetical protein GGS22DRAFT_162233 [Annulohypoxylon maeteangense]
MSGTLIKTSYASKAVDVPPDFLRTDPSDAEAITFKQIDFTNSPLPEFKGLYAVVLDHVLSPSECAQLIKFAEASVADENRSKETGLPWSPALVNAGGGYEVSSPTYRNSDRIIWDNQDMVDRIWGRLERVPEIRESLISFTQESTRVVLRSRAEGGAPARKPEVWDFHCVNKRMRFLKYGKDQFFRPHCDSPYGEVTDDGHAVMTHYTLHLYLNDSKQEVGEKSELVGGATSFLSSNQERKLDVDPKAGRILIFQHRRLYHSGDEVKAGTKYTMRTDIMYRQRVS